MACSRLIGIGSSSCDPHTGAVDGMVAAISTAGLVGPAWPGRVVAGMNRMIGVEEYLNASSIEELKTKLLCLIRNPRLIDELSQHMWREMRAGRGFYDPDRIKVCMQQAVQEGLVQVHASRGDRGLLKDIDLAGTAYSPKFEPGTEA